MEKDKKSNSKKSGQLMNGKLLKVHTKDALDNYFDNLNGQKPGDLYSLVLGQVEEPLFKVVMNYTNGNQSRPTLVTIGVVHYHFEEWLFDLTEDQAV